MENPIDYLKAAVGQDISRIFLIFKEGTITNNEKQRDD